MKTEFITEYIDYKIKENAELIILTYYELRVKLDLSNEQMQEFLELARIRLRNNNYKTYDIGESYTYNGLKKVVAENEMLVAMI